MDANHPRPHSPKLSDRDVQHQAIVQPVNSGGGRVAIRYEAVAKQANYIGFHGSITSDVREGVDRLDRIMRPTHGDLANCIAGAGGAAFFELTRRNKAAYSTAAPSDSEPNHSRICTW
jgi:hypothetical protein